MAAQRLVSVIVPCRNERNHILAFCDAVAQQKLPEGVELEVWIADGMSDDGTRELLTERAAVDTRLHVVDNPGRIVSTGLNSCLRHARGDVIVRMDVHTVYAPDYVAECIAALDRTGADNVGGPWKAEGVNPMQRAVAAAFQSRLVSGGARSRQLDYEGEADTVYLGCWPRSTFARFGEFDEQLVRNQDDEHNLRISLGGGRIWQSARIRSTYRPRSSLQQVFRQYMQYGYWKPFVMRKHGQAAALRQLVPGAFVATVLFCFVFAILGSAYAARLGISLAIIYALFVSLAAVRATPELSLAPRVAAVVAAYHLGYGWGTLRGWLDVLLRGRPSPRFGVLTR
jgi:succinoglycan biosynthesis protein ExoA